MSRGTSNACKYRFDTEPTPYQTNPTQKNTINGTVILSLAGGGGGGCVRGLNIDRYTTTNLDKPGVDSCDTFSIDDQHTE